MLKPLIQRLAANEIDAEQAAADLASLARARPADAAAALAMLKAARGAGQISTVSYHRLCSAIRAAAAEAAVSTRPNASPTRNLDEPEETVLAPASHPPHPASSLHEGPQEGAAADDEAPTMLARVAQRRDRAAAQGEAGGDDDPAAPQPSTGVDDASDERSAGGELPKASTPADTVPGLTPVPTDDEGDAPPTVIARIPRSRAGTQARDEPASDWPPPATSGATDGATDGAADEAADRDEDGDEDDEPPTVLARLARGRHGASAGDEGRDRFRPPWERGGGQRPAPVAGTSADPPDTPDAAPRPADAAGRGADREAIEPELTVLAPTAAADGDVDRTVIADAPDSAGRVGGDAPDAPEPDPEQTVLAGTSTGQSRITAGDGEVDAGTSSRSDLSSGAASTSRSSQRSWTPPGGETTPELQGLGPGSMIKDRFVLEKVLGSGGMGKVYLARDQLKVEARDRNPHVALKVLTEDFKEHPEAFIALQREASRQQRLAHPNIATVYDFDRVGQSGTQVFITMEFLDGSPLNTFIRKEVRPRQGLPPGQAIPMIAQLGAALAYAHQRDIVHSDFKPGNAFVCKDGAVKVLDFGIARAVQAPATAESGSAGEGDDGADHTYFDAGQLGALTPAYASLEMIRGEVPDRRDDIYALACVAYELLAGAHPFARKSAAKAEAEGLVPAPIKSLKRRQMRGLLRGLAFKREHRSPDVETFVEEIEGRLNWRRNPYVIGGALAAALALASVGPVLNWIAEQRIQQQVSDIRTGDTERIEAILAGFETLDASARNTITEAARPALQTHFEIRIRSAVNPHIGAYDFAAGERELARAKVLYPDSATVNELEAFIDDARHRWLNTLNQQFMTALEEDRLLPDEGSVMTPAVPEILAQVASADADHALLSDPRVPTVYAGAAQGAINQGDPTRARTYLDVGERLAPGDVELINTRARYETARADHERLALAEELRSIFDEPALDPGELLRRFGEASGRIAALARLAQDDPMITALTRMAAPRMQEHLESFTTDEHDAARAFVADYGEVLEALGLHALIVQARLIASAGSETPALRGQIADDAEDGLEAALADPRFDRDWRQQVRDHLRYLEAALIPGAGADRLVAARDAIAAAYSERAAELASDQRYAEALALLERARSLELERSIIEERYASVRAADRELQRERQQRAQQARLQGFKETMLIQARAGDLNGATDTYDVVEALLPVDDPFLTVTAPDALGAAFRSAATMQAEMGNPRAALRIADRGRAYAPGHRALNDAWQGFTVEVNILDLRDTFSERDTFDTARVARMVDELRLWAPARYRQLEPELISSLDQRIRALARANHAGAQRLAIRGSNVFPASTRLAQLREQLAPPPWPEASAARAALSSGRLSETGAIIDRGSKEQPDHPEVRNLQEDLEQRMTSAQSVLARFRGALEAGDLADARRHLADARSQWADNRELGTAQAELSARIAQQTRNGSQVLLPSQTIEQLRESAEATGTDEPWEPIASSRPCTTALAGYGARARAVCHDLVEARVWGPLLVVVPGGALGEPLAVTQHEISVEDYNKYCYLSGDCAVDDQSPPSHPRTGLSVAAIDAYAAWLSARTGYGYRLPTDMEWTYAANADGVQPPRDVNCRVTLAGQALEGDALVDVDAGRANGWGLKGYIGNARELVVGEAELAVRGGSYQTPHADCSLELRQGFAGQPDDRTGFRLVREGVPHTGT